MFHYGIVTKTPEVSHTSGVSIPILKWEGLTPQAS